MTVISKYSSASRSSRVLISARFLDGAVLAGSCEDAPEILPHYLADLARIPFLSAEEEARLYGIIACELQERAQHGNGAVAPPLRQQAQEARQRLIEAHLRLVLNIARRYRGRGLAFFDVVQEGNLGLIQASKSFDPRRGKFSTHATWQIWQKITSALNEQARLIRLPAYLETQLARLVRTFNRLSGELGREPTINELAGALSQPPEQVRECLAARNRMQMASLDQSFHEDEEATRAEMVMDVQRADFEERVLHEILQRSLPDDIARLLSAAQLTPREQEVLALHFGLHDGEERSLAEIGRLLSMSRMRPGQLLQQALKKLRRVDFLGELEQRYRA